MSMIKIGMIGIAAVFLALLLKKEKGELALLVGITHCQEFRLSWIFYGN